MIKRNFIAALIGGMLALTGVANAAMLDLGDNSESAPQQWTQEVKFADPNQGTTVNGVRPIPEMSTFFPIIGLLVAVGATHVLRRRRLARVSS